MLRLTLEQRTFLEDLDPLNNINEVIGTGFDDPNLVVEENFDDYDSGRKNILDAGEILTLTAHFTIRFLFIESKLFYDLELTQPAYTRTINTNATAIPQSITTHTSLSRIHIQFGLWEKIEITSLQNANPIKYFLLGTKDADLTF